MRGFVFGFVFAILIAIAAGYLFVRNGGVQLATSSQPLPGEKEAAEMALKASMGKAKEQKDPLPLSDENMIAGAATYKQHCAVCHGTPQQPQTMISKGMFPKPPQLFEKEDMMTDDPEGETFWKVTHGIRLSGMPGFASALSDAQRWQVTMLIAHADKLSPEVQGAMNH